MHAVAELGSRKVREHIHEQDVLAGGRARVDPRRDRRVVALDPVAAEGERWDNGAIGWLSDHVGQLACLFGSGNASSLLAAACALPNVDCELGIAAWGHSQGAYMAEAAASFDPRVRAVWTAGYGGDAPTTLPSNRLRVVNGEADTLNGTVAVLNPIAGFSASECPDDGRAQCLRDDGSGWIIVRRADLALPDLSSADHCWSTSVRAATR